jgi:hypothetical protein
LAHKVAHQVLERYSLPLEAQTPLQALVVQVAQVLHQAFCVELLRLQVGQVVQLVVGWLAVVVVVHHTALVVQVAQHLPPQALLQVEEVGAEMGEQALQPLALEEVDCLMAVRQAHQMVKMVGEVGLLAQEEALAIIKLAAMVAQEHRLVVVEPLTILCQLFTQLKMVLGKALFLTFHRDLFWAVEAVEVLIQILLLVAMVAQVVAAAAVQGLAVREVLVAVAVEAMQMVVHWADLVAVAVVIVVALAALVVSLAAAVVVVLVLALAALAASFFIGLRDINHEIRMD